MCANLDSAWRYVSYSRYNGDVGSDSDIVPQQTLLNSNSLMSIVSHHQNVMECVRYSRDAVHVTMTSRLILITFVSPA